MNIIGNSTVVMVIKKLFMTVATVVNKNLTNKTIELYCSAYLKLS